MTQSDTLEPAYLLHLRRYRNTSALTELLTANHGRVGAVAKGVFSKGAHAQQLRAQLQLATPLLVTLGGRSELKSMLHVEAIGAALQPSIADAIDHDGAAPVPARSHALYCVMYVNELLVRLLPAHFACPALFAAYQAAMQHIAQDANPENALRSFELQLLDTLGYGIDFRFEAGTGHAITAEGCYRFVPGSGFVPAAPPSGAADEFAGSELLAFAAGGFAGEGLLRSAKRLMRLAINHQLGGRPLHSRALFRSAAGMTAANGQDS